MGSRCPGQSGRNLQAKLHQCPNCGYEVEIFSDELKVICPNCRQPVYQETMPSCIDWCPAAQECVGPEKWQQLEEERAELAQAKRAAIGPIKALGDEHRLIERLLRVLEGAARGLEEGEEVSPRFFKRALKFVRMVADRCHHGKEEDSLFPLLEEHGVAKDGGPLGVLLQGHAQGREFVRRLAEGVKKYEAGIPGAREEISENARGYIELLAQHIRKEDEVLFPIADHLLSQNEQQRLLERFEAVERERIGEGGHRYLEQLISELEELLASAPISLASSWD